MAQPSTQPPVRSSNTETFSQDSYNHGGLITFLISMGVSILFFIVLLVLYPGVDLREVTPDQGVQQEAAPEAGAPAATTEEQAQ